MKFYKEEEWFALNDDGTTQFNTPTTTAAFVSTIKAQDAEVKLLFLLLQFNQIKRAQMYQSYQSYLGYQKP